MIEIITLATLIVQFIAAVWMLGLAFEFQRMADFDNSLARLHIEKCLRDCNDIRDEMERIRERLKQHLI